MSGSFWVLLFFGCFKVYLCQLETVKVKISSGELRGKIATSVTGLNYYSFQGIPYAKPPIGPLRFKAPQPADSWEGVRDALIQGPVCPQIGYIYSEDCLFVNVYTTYLPKTPNENLRPVLVWIHGGSYHYGSGNIEQQGPDYLLEEDIVIVTLNYRLGALGFLSLQGTEVSSNNGLKDQSLALRWIQQNIAQFGGNPDNVTIWGESAGAGSVHAQILSPMSKGLFHQVISESGSLLSSWSLHAPGTARALAFKLGQLLGVVTNDTSVLIKSLQYTLVQYILEVTFYSGIQFTVDIEYNVTSEDEAFLPAPPIELIKEGKYNDVPLLIGTNANEGLVLIGLLLQGPEYLEYLNNNFELLLPWHVQGSTDIVEKVKKFYLGDKKLSLQTGMQFSTMETDFMYLYPVTKQILLQTAVSSTPIYYYKFSFDGLLGLGKRSQGDSIPGVSHAEELGYIFYTSYNDPHLPADRPEITTLKRMVKMWTNFVKTGNPTPSADPLLQNITWRPFTKQDHYYLDIGQDLIHHRDIANDRLGFIADIYESINIPM